MRSSHLAIRSVFHSRRLTCQVPRKKAVMGMIAVNRVVMVLVGCLNLKGRGPRMEWE